MWSKPTGQLYLTCPTLEWNGLAVKCHRQCELSQWLCYDDSTINILKLVVVVIIIIIIITPTYFNSYKTVFFFFSDFHDQRAMMMISSDLNLLFLSQVSLTRADKVLQKVR